MAQPPPCRVGNHSFLHRGLCTDCISPNGFEVVKFIDANVAQALQLFIAPHPLRYLTSRYGIIDFLTIIPALVIVSLPHTYKVALLTNVDGVCQWAIPGSHSKMVFVLRVLRVFRSLRILRLTQYIRFKKHGFEYEVTARFCDRFDHASSDWSDSLASLCCLLLLLSFALPASFKRLKRVNTTMTAGSSSTMHFTLSSSPSLQLASVPEDYLRTFWGISY